MRNIILLLIVLTIWTGSSYAEVVPSNDVNFQSLGSFEEDSYNYLMAQQSRRYRNRKRRFPKINLARSLKDKDLLAGLRLAERGNYQDASIKLFQLGHRPRYRKQRHQIKYILGLILYQMEFNQLSAFQFISVVKRGRGKYLKQSLEKLSLAADALGDNSLLNYTISKIKIKDFPRVHRDMLYYRIGEFQMHNSQFSEAAKSFGRVGQSSSFYNKAKYLQALAYSENNQIERAVATFDQFISIQPTGLTQHNRILGTMGKARAFYQGKKWGQAIKHYRSIPKDSKIWHDTLFESSWAMLRSGRFRSVLSNFQSLHSPYYKDFYIPESLLLRAIVYLYICKYEELDKVLDVFNKTYKPIGININNYLKSYRDPTKYFNDVIKVLNDYRRYGEEIIRSKYELPFQVTRRIIKEGDFQRSYGYIKELIREKRRVEAMPVKWRNSAMGRYAKKVLSTRIHKARKKAGKEIRAHLLAMKIELNDFFEQESFIRFEKGNSLREHLKKAVAGKRLPDEQVNRNRTRDFYIKDGFEYWPFQGEYWLDELGNYHYLGIRSCGS